MARNPFRSTAGPSYAGGGEPEPEPPAGGPGGEPTPPPSPPPGNGLPPGATFVTEPITGNVIVYIPGSEHVGVDNDGNHIITREKPQIVNLGRAPLPRVGRAPKDPQAIILDQLRIEAARRAAAEHPEDRETQRDIARQRLGLETRDQALKELINAEGSWAQRAADLNARGQLEEAKAARLKANEFSLRRAELEDRDLGLRAELGYADSRRADTTSNVNRANVFGQDIDGKATGTVGMLTAGEQQRRFGNANLIGQQNLAQGNLEQQRKTDSDRYITGLRMQQDQQRVAQGQAEGQDARAQLGLQLQFMNQRAAGPMQRVTGPRGRGV